MHLRQDADMGQPLDTMSIKLLAFLHNPIFHLKGIRLQDKKDLRIHLGHKIDRAHNILFNGLARNDGLNKDIPLTGQLEKLLMLPPERPAFRRARELDVHRNCIHIVDDLLEPLIKNAARLQVHAQILFPQIRNKFLNKIRLQ